MSETILNQLVSEQHSMTKKAMRLVLIIALCIHALLNVFAYINHDPILKIEMPILSGITVIAVLVITKVFKHE